MIHSYIAGTRYYVQRNRDKTLHVQAVVGSLTGQHFVCNAAGFARWKVGVPAEAILWCRNRSADCDCGMHAGEYRDAFGGIDSTSTAREQLVAEIDRVAGELDASDRLFPNERGALVRVHGTRFYRKPPRGAPADEPTDRELCWMLGTLRGIARQRRRP